MSLDAFVAYDAGESHSAGVYVAERDELPVSGSGAVLFGECRGGCFVGVVGGSGAGWLDHPGESRGDFSSGGGSSEEDGVACSGRESGQAFVVGSVRAALEGCGAWAWVAAADRGGGCRRGWLGSLGCLGVGLGVRRW